MKEKFVQDRKFTLIAETDQTLDIQGHNYRMLFDRKEGKLSEVKVFNGLAWHKITASGHVVGDNWNMPLISCQVAAKESDYLKIETIRESDMWRVTASYEVFAGGYVVCTFALEALVDQAVVPTPLSVGIALDEEVVFSRPYRVTNNTNNIQDPRSIRALSIDFTTDDRPVTNSLDFLLEGVTANLNNRACEKVIEQKSGYRFLSWRLSKGYNFPFPKGFRYENRWALTITGLNNGPNKVRGQRIYHWYGRYPHFPGNDVLVEMAEYGCSILALHTVSRYISGFEPVDENEMRRVVKRAHELGIKVLFYCQPYLISMKAPYYKEFTDSRTECLRIWHAGETQICEYESDGSWNCDELCLRCDKAYKFMREGVIACYRKFNCDGLYIDFCWPAQGLCNDAHHGHGPGMFNFYDYWRILRQWRKDIGHDAIMIGHGGGFLVSSDFVEGFDACLTGEAQKELDPITVGQQFGLAPTLWTMQRMKEEEFRSIYTVERLIREGVTPHVGVGIMGTAVKATLDPAHHTYLMGLWQMWRAFPVEKATYHNYLFENIVTLDNKETFYSLYVTADKQVLLILANSAKPAFEATPAVRVRAKIDIDKLGLPAKLNCWRMKGATYETFRIAEMPKVENGLIDIPEIEIHEYIGFVLSPADPPVELTKLMKHLEGRFKRLPSILDAKQMRLAECDRKIDYFGILPNARIEMDYKEFMRNRVAE
jgi:hypothetical protein